MPGPLAEKRSPSVSQYVPQPVWMSTASPGLQRDLLAVERLLQVVHRDLVARGQNLDALERRYVDQYPARHKGADVLDAEPREPRAGHHLVHGRRSCTGRRRWSGA